MLGINQEKVNLVANTRFSRSQNRCGCLIGKVRRISV